MKTTTFVAVLLSSLVAPVASSLGADAAQKEQHALEQDLRALYGCIQPLVLQIQPVMNQHRDRQQHIATVLANHAPIEFNQARIEYLRLIRPLSHLIAYTTTAEHFASLSSSTNANIQNLKTIVQQKVEQAHKQLRSSPQALPS